MKLSIFKETFPNIVTIVDNLLPKKEKRSKCRRVGVRNGSD
jgi:hypothetical protein